MCSKRDHSIYGAHGISCGSVKTLDDCVGVYHKDGRTGHWHTATKGLQDEKAARMVPMMDSYAAWWEWVSWITVVEWG